MESRQSTYHKRSFHWDKREYFYKKTIKKGSLATPREIINWEE